MTTDSTDIAVSETPVGPTDPRSSYELMNLVSDEVAEKVRAGVWELKEGKNPDKPAVIDAHTKRIIGGVGSGQLPGAADLGEISRQFGYKRSKPYRQAIELLAPWDQGPEVKGSLAWIYDKVMWGAEGSPQLAECQHPGCGGKHSIVLKPDTATAFKMLELLVGKAPATLDMTVDATMELLTVALQRRVDKVEVLDSDDDEAQRRYIDLTSRSEVGTGSDGEVHVDSVEGTAPTEAD